jgi:uncharacterized protein YyaL (SSP411 family)
MSHCRLAGQSRPNLRQHKDNPVYWNDCEPEAFSAAKQQSKPILLSIDYAASHWCHVMATENFEVYAIAGLVNDLLINIEIDRDERSGIDHIYTNSLHMMGKQGGNNGATKLTQPNFSSSCGVLINEQAISRIRCRLNYPRQHVSGWYL